jgi:RNA polymerase sigma-70 factor (ECF subfamily)
LVFQVNDKQTNDSALVQKVAQGDENALGELYDRYARLVFSVTLNMIGNRQTAEEITLDVFCRLWEKADTYRPELAKLPTWLTRMARNRTIDVLRKEDVRPSGHSVTWAEAGAAAISNENPETAADLTLEMERVRSAVAELPEKQQQVLALAYFRGYSHSEIAAELNLPLGTVKGRIRGGMQKLREQLVPSAMIEEGGD